MFTFKLSTTTLLQLTKLEYINYYIDTTKI